MPWKVCASAGCSTATQHKYCTRHLDTDRARDRARGSSTQRGYGAEWQRARAEFLAVNRWCIDCARDGFLTYATDVDHDEPHKGDAVKFWDRSNWRARCHSHHSRKTATQDGGFGRAPAPIPGQPTVSEAEGRGGSKV